LRGELRDDACSSLFSQLKVAGHLLSPGGMLPTLGKIVSPRLCSWQAVLAVAALAQVHCFRSNDQASMDQGPGPADAGADDAGPADASASPVDSSTDDAGDPNLVTFRFKPGWPGVQSVGVIGGFGMTTDWTTPVVSLMDDGSGTWVGSVHLPDGKYLYRFKVTGDAEQINPTTLAREGVDPLQPDWDICPASSPFNSPPGKLICSRVTVPAPGSTPSYHVKGTVQYDGAPKSGYWVVLQRFEDNTYNVFANRTDSAADGTFDLLLSAGNYWVEVQYPQAFSTSDLARDPRQLKAVKRTISARFTISGDRTLNPAEVSYPDYDQMKPVDGGVSLPAHFSFTVIPGAASASLAIYGPAGVKIAADPLYSSSVVKTSPAEVVFDGGISTGTIPSGQYLWGTWVRRAAPDGGVSWSAQSMVFPVRFP
jgi:hypothetical protein